MTIPQVTFTAFTIIDAPPADTVAIPSADTAKVATTTSGLPKFTKTNSTWNHLHQTNNTLPNADTIDRPVTEKISPVLRNYPASRKACSFPKDTCVSKDLIKKAMLEAHEVKKASMERITPNCLVVPKDLTTWITSAHMSFDDSFLDNSEWSDNSDSDSNDGASINSWSSGHGGLSDKEQIDAHVGYIREMVKVGKRRDFKVVVNCTEDGKTRLRSLLGEESFNQIQTIRVPRDALETWTEDSGHFSVNDEVSIPATVIYEGDVCEHSCNLHRARAKRYYSDSPDKMKELEQIIQLNLNPVHEEQMLRENFPLIEFDRRTVGAVKSSGQPAILGEHTMGMVARGVAVGKQIRENYTYQEGGNTLVGIRKDGTPYALIGRDSAEYSRSILEKDLNRLLVDYQLMDYLAADLGIQKQNVILVEQPGVFHLDMIMVLMGAGQVAVNDPISAANLAETWIRDLDNASDSDGKAELENKISEMHKNAKRQKFFIDKTVAEIASAGLEVLCIPMVFDGPLIGKMNFANGEGGVDANGQKFFITNGGKQKAQQFISEKFAALFGAEVHFVDSASSEISLSLSGGVGCRVTLEGRISENWKCNISSVLENKNGITNGGVVE